MTLKLFVLNKNLFSDFGTMDVSTNKEVHTLTKFHLGNLSMLHTANMFLYEDIVKGRNLFAYDIKNTLSPSFDSRNTWVRV